MTPAEALARGVKRANDEYVIDITRAETHRAVNIADYSAEELCKANGHRMTWVGSKPIGCQRCRDAITAERDGLTLFANGEAA